MPRTATRTPRKRSTPSRSARRSRAKAQTALDLLKDDHAEVTKMFKQFERFHKNEDNDGMRECAQSICKALTIHARIEEEIFYPALRQAADAEDALDEADVEHAHIKELVGQVEGGEPGDAQFEARVTVLSEYVKHHVEEEESTIFSKARKSGVDLAALGEKLLARKQELGGEEIPGMMEALVGEAQAGRGRGAQRAAR